MRYLEDKLSESLLPLAATAAARAAAFALPKWGAAVCLKSGSQIGELRNTKKDIGIISPQNKLCPPPLAFAYIR